MVAIPPALSHTSPFLARLNTWRIMRRDTSRPTANNVMSTMYDTLCAKCCSVASRYQNPFVAPTSSCSKAPLFRVASSPIIIVTAGKRGPRPLSGTPILAGVGAKAVLLLPTFGGGADARSVELRATGFFITSVISVACNTKRQAIDRLEQWQLDAAASGRLLHTAIGYCAP